MATQQKLNNHAIVPYEKGTLANLKAEDIPFEDEKGYELEKPPILYVKIRHKELRSEDGKKVVREPGGFNFGDELPDEEVIEGTVMAVFKGRVYFESLESPQPECKSIDGIYGSRIAEGDKFGICEKCVLGTFLHNERPECREIRNLCIMRPKEPTGFILTLGPSGLKPWRIYNQKVLQEGRRTKSELNVAPHHLTVVRIATEFKSTPAPHFIPIFELLGLVPKAQREAIRQEREALLQSFRGAVEAQEHKVEDFLGTRESNSFDDE